MTNGREAEKSWAKCQGGSAIRVSREGWKGTANEKGNVRRFEEAAKAWLIGAGLSVALMLMAGAVAPSMAEDSLEQDFGIIRACGSDVWSLCSGVLPDV